MAGADGEHRFDSQSGGLETSAGTLLRVISIPNGDRGISPRDGIIH